MPKGDNVWNQTLKQTRRRNVGDLVSLRRKLWHWLKVIDDGVAAAVDTGDTELAIKWIHCGNQTAAAYAKVTVGEDFEERLKLLESQPPSNNGSIPNGVLTNGSD